MGIVLDVRRRGLAARGTVACSAISGIVLGVVATLCRYPSSGRHALGFGACVACFACAANALVISLTVVAAARRARHLAAGVEMTLGFADVAAVSGIQHRAMLEARVINADLNRALNRRVLFEQAKGIVGEREGLNMEQASLKLREHARDHSLRLVDVASDVIAGTPTVSWVDRSPTTPPSCRRPNHQRKRARRRHR
jgi:ANTAR domain